MHAEAAAPDEAHAPRPARAWAKLQERAVDGIKRAALRQLHASAAGERLLLRVYLVGEKATELALRGELVGDRPAWLARQMQVHLAQEEGHARLFAAALAERGVAVPAAKAGRPDGLSRIKIRQWHRIARRYATGFEAGILVPAFAIGLCTEQMAERVLSRHCDVIGEAHPFHALLARVLADERRHVGLCLRTLERIVHVHERPALARLTAEVRAVDRSFGITGALAMLGAGLGLRLVSRSR